MKLGMILLFYRVPFTTPLYHYKAGYKIPVPYSSIHIIHVYHYKGKETVYLDQHFENT